MTGEAIHRVNLHVNNMLQRGQISENTSNYLTTDIDRTQQFDLLPKIHKDIENPPGRLLSQVVEDPQKNIPVCGPLYRITSATIRILYKGLNPHD